jgi:dephospho-CoA kinase
VLKIGLTGGIGCGKSTVAELFAQLNVPIIDADVIAHQLVAIGQPALTKIQQQFGDDILLPEGALNRKLLAVRIFKDNAEKQKLELLLHPLIYNQIEQELSLIEASYCLICVPLLFETNMAHWVNRVLVVDCPVELQLQRVQQRDNTSPEKIQAIINSQVSRYYRQQHADDLIDNALENPQQNTLAQQVKNLHNLYLSLSAHTG